MKYLQIQTKNVVEQGVLAFIERHQKIILLKEQQFQERLNKYKANQRG